MTTLGAPFSLLRPICKLVGNGKESPSLSKRLVSRPFQVEVRRSEPARRGCLAWHAGQSKGKSGSPCTCKRGDSPTRSHGATDRRPGVRRDHHGHDAASCALRRSEIAVTRSFSWPRVFILKVCNRSQARDLHAYEIRTTMHRFVMAVSRSGRRFARFSNLQLPAMRRNARSQS